MTYKCKNCLTFKDSEAKIKRMMEGDKGVVATKCEKCKRWKIQDLEEFTK